MKGKVFLVGAGPGDYELLTQKAINCIKKAQIIVYDYLINSEILKLAPSKTKLIYVGKKGGSENINQTKINELLCDLAKSGKNIVRLKGGDPFVFGRGGEEADALFSKKIPFEIIPGITSAIAVPSYAGIPITDRRFTSEVVFVTGHEDPLKKKSSMNWASLATMESIVFLMGIKNISHICKQLIHHGKDPDTPAATIRWGTTPRQLTVTSTLKKLPKTIIDNNITSPAITIIGKVVSLRKKLSWFEKLPLFGKRILVTRTREQASSFSNQLKRLGAEIIEIPTIKITPPKDPSSIITACKKIEKYDWIIFTSVNAVKPFFKNLNNVGKDSRNLYNSKIAVIGPSTQKAILKQGINPDIIGSTYTAEGLLEELKKFNLENKKILIPRAKKAREILPQTLSSQKAKVDVVTAYETTIPNNSSQIVNNIKFDQLDLLTFTSSSTVKNFFSLLSSSKKNEILMLNKKKKIIISSIGPITSQTAKKSGLNVQIEPPIYTIKTLTKEIVKYFSSYDSQK